MNGLEVVRRLSPSKTNTSHHYDSARFRWTVLLVLIRGRWLCREAFEIEEILARLRALFVRLQMEEQSRKCKNKNSYRDLCENRKCRSSCGRSHWINEEQYELLFITDGKHWYSSFTGKKYGAIRTKSKRMWRIRSLYPRNKIDVPGRESYIQNHRGTDVMRSWGASIATKTNINRQKWWGDVSHHFCVISCAWLVILRGRSPSQNEKTDRGGRSSHRGFVNWKKNGEINMKTWLNKQSGTIWIRQEPGLCV